jgi:acetyltransferase-like isoleucine patch superfamily enzyme
LKFRSLVLYARYGLRALAEIVRDQVNEHTEPVKGLAHVGKGTYLHSRCSIKVPENIWIGDLVIVSQETRLWASPNAKLILHDYVGIGPNVNIFTSNRGFASVDVPMHVQPWEEADVTIEKGVWLGANAVVLPGVTIHEGAVVGAGAVVTGDVAAFSIVGGVPARIIRSRK